MTRFHFERPDGPPSNNAQNILVHLNEFVPPQGFGEGEAPPTGIFLLDLFPGAAAAYSLRLLRTAYEGPAIRVIRTSDNAEQDIGFLPDGNLDVDALEDFVNELGASDALITILYDQSGNNIDLDAQTTQSDLPKIIIAGALQTVNNLPTLNFDGIDDVLFTTLSLSSPAPEIFLFMVHQKLTLTDNGRVFNLDSPNTSTGRRCFASIPFSNNAILWDAGSLAERLATGAGFNDLLQHQYSLLMATGTDNQQIRRDGIQEAEQTPPDPSTIVSEICLGNSTTTGSTQHFNWQEFVFYNIDVLVDVVAIETNQIDYWMALFLRVTANGDQRVTPEGDRRILA